jgi:hypothetical protein
MIKFTLKIMCDIDLWGIDVFLIDELTLNRPLTAVVYTIFQVKYDLITISFFLLLLFIL